MSYFIQQKTEKCVIEKNKAYKKKEGFITHIKWKCIVGFLCADEKKLSL
jgi:hypothetical protein